MKITRKLWLIAVLVTLLTLLPAFGVSAEVTNETCGATDNESNVTGHSRRYFQYG